MDVADFQVMIGELVFGAVNTDKFAFSSRQRKIPARAFMVLRPKFLQCSTRWPIAESRVPAMAPEGFLLKQSDGGEGQGGSFFGRSNAAMN